MAGQAFIELNDGCRIPQLGLGVWQASNSEAASAVRKALETGYRHVDTAAIYENERGVGEGIRASGLARGDIFLTTKLWNESQTRDAARRAFDASLKKLGTDYVDLYLIHWPSPRRGTYVEAWKALVELKNEGRVRSVGVSNFCEDHLERIIGETGVAPAINQIELHPDFQQKALRTVHARLGITTESWSPLGQGKLLAHPAIARTAARLGRTPAQVIIRWHIENGLVVIPKSVTPARIAENFRVFDFALDAEACDTLDALDGANRVGPDPMTAAF